MAATERPHNEKMGQMKVGSSAPEGSGIVWQLVGVGHEVLLLSAWRPLARRFIADGVAAPFSHPRYPVGSAERDRGLWRRTGAGRQYRKYLIICCASAVAARMRAGSGMFPQVGRRFSGAPNDQA